MTESLTTRPETAIEHELSAEEVAEASQDLGEKAAEQTIQMDTVETEKRTSQETAAMIDEHKAEHGSVNGLSIKELIEQGFDPDMTLLKIGNERLEERLEITKTSHRAERGTPQWESMLEIEARSLPVSAEEIDAAMEAGANPQNIVDALQQRKPEDDKDNYSSSLIAARIDKLVEAGLPPSTIAARMNPSWREASKDKLDHAEETWRETNRLKAVA